MKSERLRARGRLLNDVLSEESGRGKAIALTAFRRARLVRRARTYGGLAVMVVAALAMGFHFMRPERPASVAVKPQAPTAVVENNDVLPKLSDAELLASFPPDSCFLAEVNGRQVLVFTDRALREKFVYQPSGASSEEKF